MPDLHLVPDTISELPAVVPQDTEVSALETRVAILETRLRLALGAIVDAHRAFKGLLQEAIAIEAELERK